MLVGDVHHPMFVPEAGGSVLNEEVPTSILNGPPWSRDQPAASLPIPVGTATVCWGPAVEEGVSGLTRRKKSRQEEVRTEGRKATNHLHEHCGKACPCEWGSLAEWTYVLAAREGTAT